MVGGGVVTLQHEGLPEQSNRSWQVAKFCKPAASQPGLDKESLELEDEGESAWGILLVQPLKSLKWGIERSHQPQPPCRRLSILTLFEEGGGGGETKRRQSSGGGGRQVWH